MKSLGVPFLLAFVAGGRDGGAFALVFGFFCVRLTKIYFAMLTLAFAQIVWAVCFKWNDVTGGEQGLPSVPYPDLGWMDALPLVGDLRVGDHFYLLDAGPGRRSASAALRRIVDSPFGRILTMIRDNPERAQFIGINVRRYQLAAFVIAGFFAGLAGALFGIFNRGVFPDFVLLDEVGRGPDHDDPRRHGRTSGARRSAPRRSSCSTSRSPPTPSTGRFVLGVILDRAALRLSRRHRRHAREARNAPAARRARPRAGDARCLRSRASARSSAASPAVDGVSFAVERGEIAAVIGPNGAGKSTLFNLITGHLRPDNGTRASSKERDITGAPPHRICRMGMGRSFQRTNIFPQLTVFENVQAAFIAHRGAARTSGAVSAILYRGETGGAAGARSGSSTRRDERRRARPTATRSRSSSASRSPATPRSCCSTSRRPGCRRPRRTNRSACSSGSPREREPDPALHRARHGSRVLDRAEASPCCTRAA